MKSKDQVLGAFKKFHASVEQEEGRKLKSVWADNAGEYRGLFQEYCKAHETKLDKTDDHVHDHYELVEEAPPELQVELELIRSTIYCQVYHRYPPHEYVTIIGSG